MNKKIFIVMLLALLLIPIYSQDVITIDEEGENVFRQYSLGDQLFGLAGGVTIPTFAYNFSENSFESMLSQMSLGLNGTIEWGSAINQNIRLGLEFGFSAVLDPNNSVFLNLPLYFKPSYVFNNGEFEVPLSLGVGAVLMRINERFYAGPIIVPQAEFYYHATYDWSFGAKVKFNVVPEIYFGELSKFNYIGNFLQIDFSAIYHL